MNIPTDINVMMVRPINQCSATVKGESLFCESGTMDTSFKLVLTFNNNTFIMWLFRVMF